MHVNDGYFIYDTHGSMVEITYKGLTSYVSIWIIKTLLENSLLKVS